jgi:predicted nucleic acid-binding protein
VIVAVDACSAINLAKSGVLHRVLGLPYDFRLGPEVVSECSPMEPDLQAACDSGRIVLVRDDDVDIAEVIRIAAFNLGDGETETIALACTFGWHVCTDDGAARRRATIEVGAARVLGTLRLLTDAVAATQLTAHEAFAAYQQMIASGAFLPAVDVGFFAPPAPSAPRLGTQPR